MPVKIIDIKYSKEQDTVYPDHSEALAFKVTTHFNGDKHRGGVFPNYTFEGSNIADRFHIHQISEQSVITKISVTFLQGGNHVAWAFYQPHPTASSTFNRTLVKKFDDTMKQISNEAFTDFIDICPTIPASAANTVLADWRSRLARNGMK